MKRVVIALLALVAPATAQTVMDGSDKNVDPEFAKAIMTQIEDELVDPYSAQIRRMRQGWMDNYTGAGRTLLVCGELNGKNRQGGYNGFSPFMYVPYRKDKEGKLSPWLIVSSQVSRQGLSGQVDELFANIARQNCSRPLHSAETGD